MIAARARKPGTRLIGLLSLLAALFVLPGNLGEAHAATPQPTPTPTVPAVTTASGTPTATTSASSATTGQTSPAPAPTAATTTAQPTPAATPTSAPPTAKDTVAVSAVTPFAAEGGGTVVAAAPQTMTNAFTMVGVSWPAAGGSGYAIRLRTHTGGAWTEWSRVEVEVKTEGAKKLGTDATYVGASDGVEVQIVATGTTTTAPAGALATVLNPPKLATDGGLKGSEQPAATPTKERAFPQIASGQPAQPAIITRAQWGAYAPDNCGDTATESIRGIVVHHTAGSNNYAAADSASIVRGIQYYHEYTLGWCDIGYNFLVDKYGQIFEGRANSITTPVQSAHAYNWNSWTDGISVMGDYSNYLPPQVTLNAVTRIAAWKIGAYYLDPFGKMTNPAGQVSDVISGHRQLPSNSTDCPGNYIFNWLPTLRQNVANLIGANNTAIRQRWQALGGIGGWLGRPFQGETPIGDGRVTRFAGGDLYQTPGGQVYFVRGDIRDRYDALGGARGRLGFPTTDENCGLRNGGCYNNFDGGAILWSSATGAWANWGAIRGRYAQLGYESGALGYPTGPEVCGIKNGGCYQNFQGGAILWSPATGAWESLAPLRALYAGQGFEQSTYGYPTGAQTCDTGGTCTQPYQGGVLTNNTAPTAEQRRFIQSVAPMAIQTQRVYGVPASVSIAQSILESGWGSGVLPTYGHAYFGIKCKATASALQSGCMDKSSLEYYSSTDPVAQVSAFRIYRSAQDSFSDHGDFLRANARYAAAFATPNADDFARAIATAGYATDPAYADKVIALMVKFGLYDYNSSATPVPGPIVVDGPIGTKWTSLGGASSPLSFAIGAETDGPVGGSRAVHFNKGLLVWTAATGAHPLYGAIWDAYRTDPSLRTLLGAPTSDPSSVRGGMAQDFSGGTLVVANGAVYTVTGAFAARYRQVGGANGVLGSPTGAATCGIRDGGCYQNFAGGAILWSPATGAWENYGPIRDRYRAVGFEASGLSYPTGPITCGIRAGGCYQDYQGGAILGSASTGYWANWGQIRQRYSQVGFERSVLGLPTGAEVCGLVSGGCYQNFEGGAIVWSPATGAWESYGPIRARWQQTGFESGSLGYATGPVTCTNASSGPCSQPYQRGTITWTAAGGTTIG